MAETWSDPSLVLILQGTIWISSFGGPATLFGLILSQSKGTLSGALTLPVGSPCHPQKCLYEFMGRSDISVFVLGHPSLTAFLQTTWKETVPCRHTGTPLAFKHRARTSLSVHFSGLPLMENSCAQTLEKFMVVPLFEEITRLLWYIWYYQHSSHFPWITSAVLPFGSCTWPPLYSHGSFQTLQVPSEPCSLHRCCKLAPPPCSLSNGVGKASTMRVHTPEELHSPGTLPKGTYSSKRSDYQSRRTLKMQKSMLPWGGERKLWRSLKNGGKTGRQEGKRNKKIIENPWARMDWIMRTQILWEIKERQEEIK